MWSAKAIVMLPACKNQYYSSAEAECVCICVGVYVYVVTVYHPGRWEGTTSLKFTKENCVCVCVYMYRLQTIFLFTLSSYPTLPSHLRAVLFNEPFKSICTWSMTYRIYNQALTHAKFLWSTHHPTSFTHSSLYFYLTHSHFSISISILSQEAILFSHFSLQKGKDMAADNKPLTKRDNKQPLLLWLRNMPRT